jgi:class 3 adenylate cyclase
MTQLRTTVVMKTDITGSTPRFRTLLISDLQALLFEHRVFVESHAADQGGQIVKPAGDGYWLQFPSSTAAAKSAIAMQEALRLAQPNKGDDRLSMRVVIGLGDVAVQEGDLIGEVFALLVRIEAITPPDEIYLTSAARLALTSAEIQTSLVDTFQLKGFSEPTSVHRVEQRHRTHVLADAYILTSDLRGFTRFIEAAPVTKVERVLEKLETLTHEVAHKFEGTIRYSHGDAYCVTFPEAGQVIAAAEQLSQNWETANHEELFGCPIEVVLHRGKVNAFRSFIYGEGLVITTCIEAALSDGMPGGEGGVFVTSTVVDDLYGSSWRNHLEPVALNLVDARLSGLAVYRLTARTTRSGFRS